MGGGGGGVGAIKELGSPGALGCGAGMIFFMSTGCSALAISSLSCHWA